MMSPGAWPGQRKPCMQGAFPGPEGLKGPAAGGEWPQLRGEREVPR